MANKADDIQIEPAPEWLVKLLDSVKDHLNKHEKVSFGVFPSDDNELVTEQKVQEITKKASDIGANFVLCSMKLKALRVILERVFAALKEEYDLYEAEGFELDKLDPVDGGVVTLTIKTGTPEKADN